MKRKEKEAVQYQEEREDLLLEYLPRAIFIEIFIVFSFVRFKEKRFIVGQSCKNGGFLSTENPSQCNCPSFWSGETCETRVCINGGYYDDQSSSCFCPLGYMGLACEAGEIFQISS